MQTLMFKLNEHFSNLNLCFNELSVPFHIYAKSGDKNKENKSPLNFCLFLKVGDIMEI